MNFQTLGTSRDIDSYLAPSCWAESEFSFDFDLFSVRVYLLLIIILH